jgi:hypothetical protein
MPHAPHSAGQKRKPTPSLCGEGVGYHNPEDRPALSDPSDHINIFDDSLQEPNPIKLKDWQIGSIIITILFRYLDTRDWFDTMNSRSLAKGGPNLARGAPLCDPSRGRGFFFAPRLH